MKLFITIFLIWNALINYFNLIILQHHSSKLQFWISQCSLGYLISFCDWAQSWFWFFFLQRSQIIMLRKLCATWFFIWIVRAIISFIHSNSSFIIYFSILILFERLIQKLSSSIIRCNSFHWISVSNTCINISIWMDNHEIKNLFQIIKALHKSIKGCPTLRSSNNLSCYGSSNPLLSNALVI